MVLLVQDNIYKNQKRRNTVGQGLLTKKLIDKAACNLLSYFFKLARTEI
jgi:hypothetical protein